MQVTSKVAIYNFCQVAECWYVIFWDAGLLVNKIFWNKCVPPSLFGSRRHCVNKCTHQSGQKHSGPTQTSHPHMSIWKTYTPTTENYKGAGWSPQISNDNLKLTTACASDSLQQQLYSSLPPFAIFLWVDDGLTDSRGRAFPMVHCSK